MVEKRVKKWLLENTKRKTRRKIDMAFLILTRLLDGETISDFIQSSCGKTLQAAFLIY